LLVAFVSPFTTPGGVFATSGIVASGAIVLSLIALRGMRPPEQVSERAEVREELHGAAATLHLLTGTMDEASGAAPVGNSSVARIDKQMTMSKKREELP
jgi:hypothetical protein